MNCRNCGETEHIRGRLGPARIGVHAALALLTKGAWLLVWLADWAREKARWACPECSKERGPLARYKTDAEFELPHKDLWQRTMAGLAVVLVLVALWPSAPTSTKSDSKTVPANAQRPVAPVPSATEAALTPALRLPTPTAQTISGGYSREQVVDARKKYKVEVLRLDAEQEYGRPGEIRSNLLRVRVTNNSEIVLPQLTALTTRWSATGERLGSSRAPALTTRDLKPGEVAELDYYALGALPGTAKVTLEVETMLQPSDEQFIYELTGLVTAEKQPPPPAAPLQQTTGKMEFVPGGHQYSLTVTPEGKGAFLFEPPIPATDGSLYGAMLDGINVMYSSDPGHWVGAQLTLKSLSSGGNALSIDAEEYVYFALPLRVSDTDRRVAGMAFWRQAR